MANEYTVNSADLVSVADAIREKGGTQDLLSFPAGFISAIQAITSGGASLGLISVSSADSLPATANEHTIAVVTEQTIGNLYVQSAVPETAVDGDVLILTVRPEKYVNMSESGMLEVGVAGAYIMIDGTWSFADTYIFVDEAWSFLWSGQLYYKGNIYTEYTGGWSALAKKAASNSTATALAPTVTDDGTAICADQGDKGKAAGGMFYTANPIDLTPYKTVVFEGEFWRAGPSDRNFTTAAWSSIGTYYTSNTLAYQYLASDTETLIELDVSSVDEAAYIGFGLTASASSSDSHDGVTRATVTRAYLIPKEM